MNTASRSPSTRFVEAVSISPQPSRLQRFVDFVLRHGGAVAVDHTHMLPLDRVSGRTGIVRPKARERCRC